MPELNNHNTHINRRQWKYHPRQPIHAEKGPEPYHIDGNRGKGVEREQGKKQNQQGTKHPNKKVEPNQCVVHYSAEQPKSPTIADFLSKDGFIKQGRRGKKGKQETNMNGQLSRSNSADKATMTNFCGGIHDQQWGFELMTSDHLKKGPPRNGEKNGNRDWALQQFAKRIESLNSNV